MQNYVDPDTRQKRKDRIGNGKGEKREEKEKKEGDLKSWAR
jgi:hypothetical protein